MPTGYTHNIEKGQSFQDFALGCARAFGACMMQRDDPMDERPKLREQSPYYEGRLLEEEAELGAFQTMNQEQKLAVGQELRDEAIESAQKYLNDKIVLKSKYESMKAQVQLWTPPTLQHVQFKSFMNEQLDNSIQFDCDVHYALKELEKKTSMSAMDFYNEKLAKLEWSVKYRDEELEKERIRVEESNKWIMDLYKSLGVEYE